MFDPAAGYEVTISNFDFGNYPNGTVARDASFRIYDAAWGLLWQHDVTGHTGDSDNVVATITSAGTLYFQWGMDWDIGIDNFVYSVARTTAPTAVHVPPALPLLVGGLIMLGVARRFG